MAVKIKLKRLGKVRAPYYRIIVIDAKAKRDGRAIEEIGKYAPKEDPSFIEVNSERAQHWLSVGAQPTEPVQAILRKTGDWQLFKGQTPPEPLKVPETKPDKKTVFEAASKEALADADESVQPSKGKKSGQKSSGGAAADKKAAEPTGEQAEEQSSEQTESQPSSEGSADSSAAQSEG